MRVSALAAAFVLAGISTMPAMAAEDAAKATAPAAKAAKAAPARLGAVREEGGLPTVAVEKYKLANGMEILLAEDHRLPLVAFNLWVHVGAKNERPGLTGFAHLFEHLMFAGTKHIPRGMADKLVEGAGGTDSNGTTDFDRTNYFFTLPSNQLELGLWIKSDMLGYMIDEVDQVALSNQQDVVRNERRQRVENQPYGVVDEALFYQLFPEGHPYRAVVIGSHADIQAANLKDVKSFFKTFYRPNNATLALVGDFKTAEAKKLLEKYFGPLKAGDPVPPVQVEQPKITAEKRAVVQDRIELPKVLMAWHTPPVFKPGDAELDYAARILAGGKSSRLYQALVYERQIAQNVSAQQYSLSLGSIFNIEAIARPGHTAEELEKAIDEEIAKLAATPPTPAEVTRARNMMETQMFQGLQKVAGIADQLNYYNQQAGDPAFLPKDVARMRAVKPEDVSRTVATYLAKNSRVVVHGVPGKQELGPEVPTPPMPKDSNRAERESVNPEAKWRAQKPAPGKAGALVLPTAKSFRLANGLTVVHLPNPGVPVVAAALTVPAGTTANPVDKPGLASYTAGMLLEGTKTRSAPQLAADIATLGASVNTTSSDDDTRIHAVALKSNFGATLDIVADILQNPAFAAEEVERKRKERLAALVQQRENPGATALVAGLAARYGLAHPLGRTGLGTEAGTKAMSRDDLARFWQAHYRPEGAALVVSGDIDFDSLKALAEAKFGSWKAAGEAVKPASVVAQPSSAKLVYVNKPDAPQTALLVVGPSPKAGDADAPAISVMNAALGGNFTSRINHQLREVKGYTYGIYSRYDMKREHGLFSIRGNIRTDVTGPAVADMFSQIEGVRAKPLPKAELEGARNSQLLSLPGLFDTNEAIAESYASAWANGRGLDYYSKLPQRLKAVTPAKALELAKKHADPAKLVVVAVGDKAKIGPQLEKLKLEPVETRDAEGNLVK